MLANFNLSSYEMEIFISFPLSPQYSQQLLLNEINATHKGKYDFFYLPIDFKNKCNVGYAFINFIEPKAIVPFFKEFNGQRYVSRYRCQFD